MNMLPLLLLLISAAPASAEEGFSFRLHPVRRESYVLSARTFGEALEEAKQQGPWHARDRCRYPGLTAYRYTYRCQSRLRDGSLELASLSVDWEHTITLPHLLHPLPGGQQRQWSAFLQGLDEHERTHVALSSHPAVRERFRSVFERARRRSFAGPEKAAREKLQAFLMREIERIGREVEQVYDDFDRLTAHGTRPARVAPEDKWN